jgi:type I restriction enzyme S subunit
LEDVFEALKGNGISKEKLSITGMNKCVLYGELYTKYSEVIDEVVSKTNVSEGTKSKYGDLLIPSSTTTTGIDLANVSTILDNNVMLGGDITILRSRKELNSMFYAYYLTNRKKKELASYSQGSTIVHLYYNHFKEMLIDFPEMEEQNKIAKMLFFIDKRRNYENEILVKYESQKKYLLSKLFI